MYKTLGIIIGLLLIGCASPIDRRVPYTAITYSPQVLYLTQVDSKPASVIDKLIPSNQNNTNINIKAIDPVTAAAVADLLTKLLPNLIQNENDIRKWTSTRSIEILIKGYNLKGTNIENIVNAFKDITHQLAY
jgi:hypothetical protein